MGKREAWIYGVAFSHDSSACLMWPFSTRGGRRPQDAYPAFNGCYAHVFLCELISGPKPSPHHEVEHLCGTKLCMNVRHLEWALHRDNCARRTEHGTQTIGERHGMSLLTEQQVLEIRAIPKRTPGVAKKYGVSTAAICLIRAGINWKHTV